MADGIEYHWVLCFTSPLSCGHGMTVTMRTGTDTLDVKTRGEAFELLVRRVAGEEGRGVDDFAVTFFSLEPNRLAAPADSPTLRLDVPEFVSEVDPQTIAEEIRRSIWTHRSPAARPRESGGSGMDFGGALRAMKEDMKATRPSWRPGWYVVLRDGEIKAHTPDGFFTPWNVDSEDLLADDWLVASPDGDIRWPDGTVA